MREQQEQEPRRPAENARSTTADASSPQPENDRTKADTPSDQDHLRKEIARMLAAGEVPW